VCAKSTQVNNGNMKILLKDQLELIFALDMLAILECYIKKDEKGRIWSMHGSNECLKNFGQETSREETTLNT
jgi:hypothetical protein